MPGIVSKIAAFARSQGAEPDGRVEASSARNRLRGIVTAVTKDTVMAKVDIQAAEGVFRATGKVMKFDGYRKVLPPGGKQTDTLLP